MKPKVKRCNLKGNKYDNGGQVMAKESYEVGDKIRFKDKFRNEEHDGTIYEINERGTYVVSYGSGITAGTRGVQKEEVIGAYPKVEVKKKRFSFFDNGGEMGGDESRSRKNKYTDYYLIVDSDERGEYKASVYNPEEKLVFRIHSIEEMNDLIESGYLKAQADEDLDGLTQYLMEMEIIPNYSQVYSEDEYLSEIQPNYEEDEDEYETNDECVEAVVDMARGVKEVADFFIVEGKLVIVFKTQLTTNEMDELNSELKGIKGCGEVFDDSFEMAFGEGYKSITLDLKTDDIEIGKFDKGGSIAEGNYHMILSQAKQVKHHVDELQDILKKEDTIEAWVVAKMENVSSTLSDVTHYLDGKSDMPMAKRGMKVEEEYMIVVRTSKGLIDKKDFDGFTKNEIIKWGEERGWKYNEKGENLGGRVLEEYEFFAKPIRIYKKTLPKKQYAEGGETRMAKRGMKVGESTKNRNYWLQEILKADLIDQLSKFQEVYENSLLCQPLDADYRAKDRKEFVEKLLKVSDDVNFVKNELLDINYRIEDYEEPSNTKDLASQKKYVDRIKKLLTKLSNTLNETYGEISTNSGYISTEDGQEFDMDYYQEIQDLVDEKLNYIQEYNNSFDEKSMAKDGMKVDKIEYPSISLKEKDLNDDQAEIYGFIENYEPLNRQMDAIRKNLMTKIARGQFDDKKAPKIFIYLINNGLISYKKLHGDIELSKKEKEEMANNMVIDFMSEAEQGNYENETFLPKKYLAEDGMFIMSYDVYDEDGELVGSGLVAEDVVNLANLIWYYDMMDEDGEEIDDIDVAKDYLEQYDYQIKSNSSKSATNKKKVRRASVK